MDRRSNSSRNVVAVGDTTTGGIMITTTTPGTKRSVRRTTSIGSASCASNSSSGCGSVVTMRATGTTVSVFITTPDQKPLPLSTSRCVPIPKFSSLFRPSNNTSSKTALVTETETLILIETEEEETQEKEGATTTAAAETITSNSQHNNEEKQQQQSFVVLDNRCEENKHQQQHHTRSDTSASDSSSSSSSDTTIYDEGELVHHIMSTTSNQQQQQQQQQQHQISPLNQNSIISSSFPPFAITPTTTTTTIPTIPTITTSPSTLEWFPSCRAVMDENIRLSLHSTIRKKQEDIKSLSVHSTMNHHHNNSHSKSKSHRSSSNSNSKSNSKRIDTDRLDYRNVLKDAIDTYNNASDDDDTNTDIDDDTNHVGHGDHIVADYFDDDEGSTLHLDDPCFDPIILSPPPPTTTNPTTNTTTTSTATTTTIRPTTKRIGSNSSNSSSNKNNIIPAVHHRPTDHHHEKDVSTNDESTRYDSFVHLRLNSHHENNNNNNNNHNDYNTTKNQTNTSSPPPTTTTTTTGIAGASTSTRTTPRTTMVPNRSRSGNSASPICLLDNQMDNPFSTLLSSSSTHSTTTQQKQKHKNKNKNMKQQQKEEQQFAGESTASSQRQQLLKKSYSARTWDSTTMDSYNNNGTGFDTNHSSRANSNDLFHVPSIYSGCSCSDDDDNTTDKNYMDYKKEHTTTTTTTTKKKKKEEQAMSANEEEIDYENRSVESSDYESYTTQSNPFSRRLNGFLRLKRGTDNSNNNNDDDDKYKKGVVVVVVTSDDDDDDDNKNCYNDKHKTGVVVHDKDRKDQSLLLLSSLSSSSLLTTTTSPSVIVTSPKKNVVIRYQDQNSHMRIVDSCISPHHHHNNNNNNNDIHRRHHHDHQQPQQKQQVVRTRRRARTRTRDQVHKEDATAAATTTTDHDNDYANTRPADNSALPHFRQQVDSFLTKILVSSEKEIVTVNDSMEEQNIQEQQDETIESRRKTMKIMNHRNTGSSRNGIQTQTTSQSESVLVVRPKIILPYETSRTTSTRRGGGGRDEKEKEEDDDDDNKTDTDRIEFQTSISTEEHLEKEYRSKRSSPSGVRHNRGRVEEDNNNNDIHNHRVLSKKDSNKDSNNDTCTGMMYRPPCTLNTTIHDDYQKNEKQYSMINEGEALTNVTMSIRFVPQLSVHDDQENEEGMVKGRHQQQQQQRSPSMLPNHTNEAVAGHHPFSSSQSTAYNSATSFFDDHDSSTRTSKIIPTPYMKDKNHKYDQADDELSSDAPTFFVDSSVRTNDFVPQPINNNTDTKMRLYRNHSNQQQQQQQQQHQTQASATTSSSSSVWVSDSDHHCTNQDFNTVTPSFFAESSTFAGCHFNVTVPDGDKYPVKEQQEQQSKVKVTTTVPVSIRNTDHDSYIVKKDTTNEHREYKTHKPLHTSLCRDSQQTVHSIGTSALAVLMDVPMNEVDSIVSQDQQQQQQQPTSPNRIQLPERTFDPRNLDDHTSVLPFCMSTGISSTTHNPGNRNAIVSCHDSSTSPSYTSATIVEERQNSTNNKKNASTLLDTNHSQSYERSCYAVAGVPDDSFGNYHSKHDDVNKEETKDREIELQQHDFVDSDDTLLMQTSSMFAIIPEQQYNHQIHDPDRQFDSYASSHGRGGNLLRTRSSYSEQEDDLLASGMILNHQHPPLHQYPQSSEKDIQYSNEESPSNTAHNKNVEKKDESKDTYAIIGIDSTVDTLYLSSSMMTTSSSSIITGSCNKIPSSQHQRTVQHKTKDDNSNVGLVQNIETNKYTKGKVSMDPPTDTKRRKINNAFGLQSLSSVGTEESSSSEENTPGQAHHETLTSDSDKKIMMNHSIERILPSQQTAQNDNEWNTLEEPKDVENGAHATIQNEEYPYYMPSIQDETLEYNGVEEGRIKRTCLEPIAVKTDSLSDDCCIPFENNKNQSAGQAVSTITSGLKNNSQIRASQQKESNRTTRNAFCNPYLYMMMVCICISLMILLLVLLFFFYDPFQRDEARSIPIPLTANTTSSPVHPANHLSIPPSFGPTKTSTDPKNIIMNLIPTMSPTNQHQSLVIPAFTKAESGWYESSSNELSLSGSKVSEQLGRIYATNSDGTIIAIVEYLSGENFMIRVYSISVVTASWFETGTGFIIENESMHSISVSDDGSVLALGLSSTALVYHYDALTLTWNKASRFDSDDIRSVNGTIANNGVSVSMSGDGGIVAVGMIMLNEQVNGTHNSGALHIYITSFDNQKWNNFTNIMIHEGWYDDNDHFDIILGHDGMTLAATYPKRSHSVLRYVVEVVEYIPTNGTIHPVGEILSFGSDPVAVVVSASPTGNHHVAIASGYNTNAHVYRYDTTSQTWLIFGSQTTATATTVFGPAFHASLSESGLRIALQRLDKISIFDYDTELMYWEQSGEINLIGQSHTLEGWNMQLTRDGQRIFIGIPGAPSSYSTNNDNINNNNNMIGPINSGQIIVFDTNITTPTGR